MALVHMKRAAPAQLASSSANNLSSSSSSSRQQNNSNHLLRFIGAASGQANQQPSSHNVRTSHQNLASTWSSSSSSSTSLEAHYNSNLQRSSGRLNYVTSSSSPRKVVGKSVDSRQQCIIPTSRAQQQSIVQRPSWKSSTSALVAKSREQETRHNIKTTTTTNTNRSTVISSNRQTASLLARYSSASPAVTNQPPRAKSTAAEANISHTNTATASATNSRLRRGALFARRNQLNQQINHQHQHKISSTKRQQVGISTTASGSGSSSTTTTLKATTRPTVAQANQGASIIGRHCRLFATQRHHQLTSQTVDQLNRSRPNESPLPPPPPPPPPALIEIRKQITANKTPGKLSLTSSSSSLSLATVKRARPSARLANATKTNHPRFNLSPTRSQHYASLSSASPSSASSSSSSSSTLSSSSSIEPNSTSGVEDDEDDDDVREYESFGGRQPTDGQRTQIHDDQRKSMERAPASSGTTTVNAQPQQPQRSPKNTTSAARATNSGSHSLCHQQRKSMPKTTTTSTLLTTPANNKQRRDISSSIKQTDNNNSNNSNVDHIGIDKIKLDFNLKDKTVDLFQCHSDILSGANIIVENLKQTETDFNENLENNNDNKNTQPGSPVHVDVEIDSRQTLNQTDDLDNQEPMVLVEPIVLAANNDSQSRRQTSLIEKQIDNNDEQPITTDICLDQIETKSRRRRRLDESDEDDTENNNKRAELNAENSSPPIITNEVKMISPDSLICNNSDTVISNTAGHHHNHHHRESSGEEFRVVKKMISESSHLQATTVQHIPSITSANQSSQQAAPTCLTKSAGPAKGQPFGLHQSINIEQTNCPTPNSVVVEQCLSDLVDNIKPTITTTTPASVDCEKVIELEPPPPPPPTTTTTVDMFNLKQQVLVDIPIRSSELIGEQYDLEARPFARGKFAQVKRCTNKETKQCFAAKCIKKRRRLVDIRHEILLEIEALKLSYYTKHIVKLYEVYETPTEMILILEMANGGELQRVIDEEEFIDEKIVQRMVRQILDGLIYLHDNQIAHLDIKPQNLLLTEPFPDGDVKLCDFGISRRITKDCEIREICGTPDYVAPEILRYDPISLATDMWSLGVLTYVLLSGYSPFGSENKQQTFCNITQATLDFPQEIFNKISQDGVDFVKRLIVREPSDRLTSRQARQHHWLNRC